MTRRAPAAMSKSNGLEGLKNQKGTSGHGEPGSETTLSSPEDAKLLRSRSCQAGAEQSEARAVKSGREGTRQLGTPISCGRH